jgi:hypothetical protein
LTFLTPDDARKYGPVLVDVPATGIAAFRVRIFLLLVLFSPGMFFFWIYVYLLQDVPPTRYCFAFLFFPKLNTSFCSGPFLVGCTFRFWGSFFSFF